VALLQHFERSGQWLFRWRSYLPLLLFVILIFGVRGYHYPNDSHSLEITWELVCLGVGLLGLVVRAVTIGYAATGSSGRVTRKQEAAALNTSGIYSTVRHPLYLGNYLMWISVALLSRNVWVVLVISLIFWLYYERIMFAEEAFLRGKFGPAYDAWAARVPAFIPRFGSWVSAGVAFQTKRVMRSERSGLLGLIICFAAFNAYVESRYESRFRVDQLWLILTVLALLFYAVLEIDKKRSRRPK
jgi:protein-S-isoprenylcysteine O-methyltransferase Ste14